MQSTISRRVAGRLGSSVVSHRSQAVIVLARKIRFTRFVVSRPLTSHKDGRGHPEKVECPAFLNEDFCNLDRDARTQPMRDEYNLQRFMEAQDQVYAAVLDELRAGEKRGHWMWYIFPQIKGLGHSAMAQKFAITSQEEAKAYLEHPVLGLRLRECTRLVIDVEGRSAEQIFYYPDNLKFRSCMTLFIDATTGNNIFQDAILKYFEGKPDQLTLDILRRSRL